MWLFQKKTLKFTISKFSKLFKHFLFHYTVAQLEFSIGKQLKKKENIEKEIEPKNRSKLPTFKP